MDLFENKKVLNKKVLNKRVVNCQNAIIRIATYQFIIWSIR